jgi:nucleoid-associated protein YgaU
MPYLIYTVQPEDRVRGLHGLAQWFYGAVERWIDLYRYNRAVIGDDPIALRPGQNLLIPYDPDQEQLRVGVHRVQPEDYFLGLSGIAARHYGDPVRAELLYRVNRGIIGENPDLLQSGQLLIIP